MFIALFLATGLSFAQEDVVLVHRRTGLRDVTQEHVTEADVNRAVHDTGVGDTSCPELEPEPVIPPGITFRFPVDASGKPQIIPVYPFTELRLRDESGFYLSEKYKLGFQAYLVPEPAYIRMLAAVENEKTCRTALGTCQSLSRDALTDAQSYYQLAKDQFTTDGALVAELTTTITNIEFDLDREREKVARLRRQRNTAWIITGGIILGAVSATVVTVEILN